MIGADLWLHFHENKSAYKESASDPYGNASIHWFGRHAFRNTESIEIERYIGMLGSASQPELPGQLPTDYQ